MLLWRPYSDPIALLSERRATAFVLCFVHAQSARCRSAFYAIPTRHCHRVAAAMLAIVLGAPQHSAFFLFFKGRLGIAQIAALV